jgi:hypothetical protein
MKAFIILALFFTCVECFSQSKCSCKKYLYSISESWKKDSLGFDQIRLNQSKKINQCSKFLIGKPTTFFYETLGYPYQTRQFDEEFSLWYSAYNEIDNLNNKKTPYLILILVFNKKHKLLRVKLAAGQDG